MGRSKHIQYTYYNAMSMTLVIGDHEVTVRECDETVFSDLVRQAIAKHSDQAILEKELAGLSFHHSADKWYCLNSLRRRGISLIDKSSQ